MRNLHTFWPTSRTRCVNHVRQAMGISRGRDDTFADLYRLQVTTPGSLHIEMGSDNLDAYLELLDDKGNVAHWDAETEPPPVMLERGWTRKSLNPGDEVTVYCYAAKNGATTAVLQKVVLANGKELTARGGGGGQ